METGLSAFFFFEGLVSETALQKTRFPETAILKKRFLKPGIQKTRFPETAIQKKRFLKPGIQTDNENTVSTTFGVEFHGLNKESCGNRAFRLFFEGLVSISKNFE